MSRLFIITLLLTLFQGASPPYREDDNIIVFSRDYKQPVNYKNSDRTVYIIDGKMIESEDGKVIVDSLFSSGQVISASIEKILIDSVSTIPYNRDDYKYALALITCNGVNNQGSRSSRIVDRAIKPINSTWTISGGGKYECIPKFGDGSPNAFARWLVENANKYTDKGTGILSEHVNVQFCLTKKGLVKNVKVLTPLEIDRSFKNKVKRLVKKSPPWSPATIKGKAVESTVQYPIDCYLLIK